MLTLQKTVYARKLSHVSSRQFHTIWEIKQSIGPKYVHILYTWIETLNGGPSPKFEMLGKEQSVAANRADLMPTLARTSSKWHRPHLFFWGKFLLLSRQMYKWLNLSLILGLSFHSALAHNYLTSDTLASLSIHDSKTICTKFIFTKSTSSNCGFSPPVNSLLSDQFVDTILP